MDQETCELLTGELGRQALAAAAALAPTLAKYPAHVDRLAKQFPSALARAALDIVLLRPKARAKFTRAEAMLFTREALEMATHEAVSRYRAQRFAPFATVADLCCGLGIDAIGLASAGCAVLAFDRNPVSVCLTRHHAQVYEVSARVRAVEADVLTDALPTCQAAFADPSRRPGGTRTLSVEEYDPPVFALVNRFPRGFPIAIKAAPGIPRYDLGRFDADAEFISYQRELKECTLNFGPLRTTETRATLLPGPHTLSGAAGTSVDETPVKRYLLDPDPAISRADLVGVLGETLQATKFEPTIALLTTDRLVHSPFALVYEVETVLPFHPRRLGDWLRNHHVGRVTIIKSGSREDVNALQTRWKLVGSEHREVILTRLAGQSVAIIARRVEPPNA